MRVFFRRLQKVPAFKGSSITSENSRLKIGIPYCEQAAPADMERVWGLDISLHRRKDEYFTKSGKVLENCHGEMANGGLVIIGSMGSDVVKRERECVSYTFQQV